LERTHVGLGNVKSGGKKTRCKKLIGKKDIIGIFADL